MLILDNPFKKIRILYVTKRLLKHTSKLSSQNSSCKLSQNVAVEKSAQNHALLLTCPIVRPIGELKTNNINSVKIRGIYQLFKKEIQSDLFPNMDLTSRNSTFIFDFDWDEIPNSTNRKIITLKIFIKKLSVEIKTDMH